MTGPYFIPNSEAQYGPSSPYAQREWETFMRRRQELLDQILQTSQSAANQFGLTPPPPGAQGGIDLGEQQ